MKLKELIIKNRSYRGYDHTRKVTREELLEMVDCARLSASSMNQQPLKFALAYEEETVDELQKATIWARKLPQLTLPHPGKEPTAFIVICQDMNINDNRPLFIRDVGVTAQSILLAATEMGLGGCMIGSFQKSAFIETLKLGEGIEPILVVAIGKPDEEVVLTDVKDGAVNYYRDENDVHYVPKRALEDIVL